MTGPSPVRFAVVGAGVIGTWHATVLDGLDGAELACVVDVDRAAADALAAEHASAACYDLDSALRGSRFDAVSVCVPSGRHADIAVAALQAGKHVIVEKPIDVTLDAADRIIAAQRASGRLATVIHQHRFDRSSRIMLEAIAGGHLGRLTSGVVAGAWWRSQSYYDSGEWRGTWELDGGGALMNQGVHATELLIAAMGRPVEVFAYTACLAHERIEVEDAAACVIRFESGALATIHGTTAAFPGVSSRIQIHGERGSVVIENDELVYIHTTDDAPAGGAGDEPGDGGNQVVRYAEGGAASETAVSDPGQLSDSHRHQYRNFLDAIAGRAELVVSLEQARLAVALTLAIYESARSGRPVAVPADTAAPSRAGSGTARYRRDSPRSKYRSRR